MARCGAHRLLPDFFSCTIKVLVDFKHSACDGFAFIKLLNPDKSKFESLSFRKPGRACQSVRIVPCHRKRRSRSLRFVPSGARKQESRQHQASCGSLRLSLSPRGGFRRTFKNLDCTTGLLSFEMSRFSTYWARGFQVQCRADPPVLGLSVRRMFFPTFNFTRYEVHAIPQRIVSYFLHGGPTAVLALEARRWL